MQIKERKILYADDGKVVTNGEVYGKIIYLAEDASADGYFEITYDEYEEILKEE